MPTDTNDIITQLSHNLSNFENAFISDYISRNSLSLLLSDYGYNTHSTKAEQNSLSIIINELKIVSIELQKNQIPFAIIKLSDLPKMVSDIDILVEKNKKVPDLLSKLGYSLEDDAEPHRTTYVKTIEQTRVSLDLHHHLSWRRVHYLDLQSIIDECEQKSIDGVLIPFPSTSHDFLITAAHCIFKHNGMSLFDILHLLLLKQSDPPALNGLSEMYEIPKKYHWKKEFENLLKFISSIESDLRLSFDEDSSIFTNFPHQFSLITVINIRIAKILRSLSLVNFI